MAYFEISSSGFSPLNVRRTKGIGTSVEVLSVIDRGRARGVAMEYDINDNQKAMEYDINDNQKV